MTEPLQDLDRTPAVGPGLPGGRWPVTAVFFLNGLTLATYLVLLPSVKAAYGLSNGEAGLIGVLFASAALVSMQFVGRLVARYGSVRVLRLGLLLLPLALVAIGLAGSSLTYAAAAVLLGAVHGTVDVAMNAHAVRVERILRRPILSGCHAAWSVSAVTASLLGAALIRAGGSPAAHVLVVAGVVIAAGLALGPLLTSPAADPAAASDLASPAGHAEGDTAGNTAGVGAQAVGREVAPGWRQGWTRTVVALGLTGTVLMICEGAALGWSGIFLHESRGATLAVASTAVLAFTGSQTAGRIFGDRLRLSYSDATLFRVGGLVGAAGLALAVFGPDVALSIVGFAVLGLGTSLLIPLMYSAVGRAADGEPGAASLVSRFTTFTYAGILAGPGLIGWIAEATSLRWTLAALVPLLAGIALAARLPGDRQRVGGQPGAGLRTAD